jgi:peptide deformylase
MTIDLEQIKLMQIPEPILRQKCEVVEFSEDLRKAADKMLNIMLLNNGIGLAANQANLPIRMFVMKTPKMKKPKTFINPVITYACVPYEDEEGCLSCPGVLKKVKRNRYVLIEYTNYEGKKIKEHLRDLDARCAQHEIDHLDGILLVDK